MLDSLTLQTQSITANTTIAVAGPANLGVDLVVFTSATASQLTTGLTLYAALGNFANNLQSRLTNPGSPGSGGRLRIRNDSAFPQPITAAGSDTIYGVSLLPPGAAIDLYCDGISGWYSVSASSAGSQTQKVTLTTANVLGMYAAPVAVLPAPGANSIIVLEKVTGKVVFNSAAFAAGGVFLLQYDSTANGAGINAGSGTIAAAIINSAANALFTLNGAAYTGGAATGLLNKGLYASNQTGAYTTGDGSVVLTIKYLIVTP
jgi:hypothetical protein